MLRRTAACGLAAAAALALPAAAQDAYVIGLTGAHDRARRQLPRAGGRGAAPLCRAASTRPAASTARRSSLICRTTRPSRQGGRQRQEAAHPGQRHPADQRQPVVDLRADDGGGQARQACRCCLRRGLPQGRATAGRMRCSSARRLRARATTAAPSLAFVKETAKEPVQDRLRRDGDPDLARRDRLCRGATPRRIGMTPVDKEIIPPPTPDYTPFATKLKEAGANWVFSWAPWVTRCAPSRRCAGSAGRATTSPWAHLEAEGELPRVKDAEVLRHRRQRAVPGRPADPPEIAEAAKAANAQVSGQPDDRRLDRRHGGRGRARRRGWPADAGQDGRPRWPTSRSTPRACAAVRSSGPRTTTSAPSSTIASIAGTRQGDRPGQGLDRLRREVISQSRRERTSAPMERGEARGRACAYARPGPGIPLRAIRDAGCSHRNVQLVVNIVVLAAIYALIACGYVLIYRVSRVLNLAHGELMMLGAYLLLDHGVAVRGHPVDGDRGGARAQPRGRRAGLSVPDAQDDRRDGAGRGAHHGRARHPAARRHGADLVGAAAVSGAGARLANPSIALPGGARISLCAALLVVRRRSSSTRRCSRSCASARWGVRMRAAGQNPLLAAQRGINLHAVYALAWGLSTLTGALAGMLIALDSGLDQHHGDDRPQGVSGRAGRRARQPRSAR